MARAIDDPDGKLATAREKLQKAVETKCATADFETALPGLCPGGACVDPPATTGRAVQGLVCNWTGYTNRAMRLSADADLVLGAGGPVPNDVYCWSRGN